ncbi:hypothetical protein [Taylorella asinigenitalis]|nr:hypothetical protein [Taylorella asinigenitalis]
MSLPSAAGYTQYDSLLHPHYSDMMLMRAYCSFVTGDITTVKYTGKLKNCGDQIKFPVQPRVQINDYHKNATLVPQEPEITHKTLVVDQGKYFNIKIDDVDAKQICEFEAFKNSLLESAVLSMKQALDEEVLMKMAMEAHPRNKGMNAGIKSGITNLGEAGNPVQITAANIIDVIGRLRIVLRESCRWQDGKMFIVIPDIFAGALYGSDLKAAYLTGAAKSPILNGKIESQILGFDVYFSNEVPTVHDEAANKTAYWIIAGNRDATGFAQQIDKQDIVPVPNSFGKFYRGLWVYGHKPLIDDGIAALYATVSV